MGVNQELQKKFSSYKKILEDRFEVDMSAIELCSETSLKYDVEAGKPKTASILRFLYNQRVIGLFDEHVYIKNSLEDNILESARVTIHELGHYIVHQKITDTTPWPNTLVPIYSEGFPEVLSIDLFADHYNIDGMKNYLELDRNQNRELFGKICSKYLQDESTIPQKVKFESYYAAYCIFSDLNAKGIDTLELLKNPPQTFEELYALSQ